MIPTFRTDKIPGLFQYFYLPQRSWGKVMFLHESVILFTGGGGVPGQVPPGTGTPDSACWDTLNKRVVRILLEWILV